MEVANKKPLGEVSLPPLRNTVDPRYLKCLIYRTLLQLEKFIQFLGHLARYQSKNSRYLESRHLEFLPMSNKFFGPLSSFLLLSQTFPKISKTFCHFFSQISLFSTLADTIPVIVPATINKNFQIEFFPFFLIECFDSIF